MPATQTIIDVDLQNLLTAIYTQNYLIDQTYINQSGNSNFLVYSAKLECTQGNKPTYLKLEEKTDTHTNQKYIGHGVTINGLPQANRSDAKPGVNIDEFGDCELLRYEDVLDQQIIRAAAVAGNMSVCAYVRNLEDQWQYFDEYDLVLVGEEYSISKKSALFCSPTQISAYQGNATGEIRAVDSGQMNLYTLLQNYRYDYNNNHLQPSITKSGSNALTTFTQPMIDEYLYLYEIYYPDRVRAFNHFARKEINGQFSAEVKIFQFMTYMLVEDKYTKKITEIMSKKRSFYLEVNNHSSQNTVAPVTVGGVTTNVITAKGEPSNFNSAANRLTMTDIVVQSGYSIPYHVFFHELGHAVDYYITSKKKFYSEIFVCELQEKLPSLSANAINMIVYSFTTIKAKKTIQDWATSDVENLLYRVGADEVNTSVDPVVTALSSGDKLSILTVVINDYFLRGDGMYTITTVTDAATLSIYNGIVAKASVELQNQHNIANIAGDIYQGTTGNQIGTGHSFDYWYYDTNDNEVVKGTKKVGDRKNEISKEAFAGFFEYKVMGVSYGITPARKTLPNTIAALEALMKEMMG